MLRMFLLSASRGAVAAGARMRAAPVRHVHVRRSAAREPVDINAGLGHVTPGVIDFTPATNPAEQMRRAIEFFFEFTSPHSYIASKRIESIARPHRRLVLWRPFVAMKPSYASEEATGAPSQALESVVGAEEAELHELERVSLRLTQLLNDPTRTAVDPGLCVRGFGLLEQYRGPEVAALFAQRVFANLLFFDKDISRPAEVARLMQETEAAAAAAATGTAASASLSPATAPLPALRDIELQLQPAEVTAYNNAQSALAVQRGVLVAPSFVVDGRVFAGLDSLPQLELWLRTGY